MKTEEIAEELRRRVIQRVDIGREMSDEDIMELIYREAQILSRTQLLGLRERESAERLCFNSIRRMDILQELVDDEEVTEVMVNGIEGIFYERKGHLYAFERKFPNEERIMDIVRQITGEGNRQISEARPILDTRLKDGSRVNIVLSPVAVNGPAVTIRKFPEQAVTMGRLAEWGALTKEVAEYMKMLVQSRYNIFISGGTGAGKTTFLNALSAYIPETDRVITIEDSAELQIQQVKNLVRLESRSANMDGENGISIRDLLKTALRMRPDRIIVGEVRGAEAIDLLQAQNTGHDGCMSTGHANSAMDMMSRMETMVLTGMEIPMAAIRAQITAAIDICVHLDRFSDGSRKVTGIFEVMPYTGGNIELSPLYLFRREGTSTTVKGRWERINELQQTEKYKKHCR